MADLPKSSDGLGLGAGIPSNSNKPGKVGSKVGGGLSKTPLDPPSFGPAPLIEETNANWHQVTRLITSDVSAAWFDGPLLGASMNERMAELGLSKEKLGVNESYGEEKLPDGFCTNLSQLGEIQRLGLSPLAQLVLSDLERRGMTGIESAVLQVGDDSFIDVDAIAQSAEAKGLPFVDDSGPGLTWIGAWQSNLGSRFLKNFRVYKDESGVETGVWFINAVVCSRPALLDETGKLASDFDKFRREILLPDLFKRVLYLSETPLPSSLFNMGRAIAFGDLDEKFWPKPVLTINDFELAVSTIENPGGDPATNFHIFPQVISLGWAFKFENQEQLDVIQPFVVDALSVAMSILEDGFRNHYAPDEGGWYSMYAEDLHEPESPVIPSSSRWIPATQVGDLLTLTSKVARRAHESLDEEDLLWVAGDGIGGDVSSAINTLAYGILLPAGRFNQAKMILPLAVAMRHLNESTNALSNLGQVFLAEGDLVSAEKTFLEALDRADRFSEGEASLFLGDIYSNQGKSADATKFFERAANSGDPEFAAQAAARLAGLDGSTSPANTPAKSLESFCTGCGSPFGSAAQKFCGNCGSPR